MSDQEKLNRFLINEHLKKCKIVKRENGGYIALKLFEPFDDVIEENRKLKEKIQELESELDELYIMNYHRVKFLENYIKSMKKTLIDEIQSN